MTETWSPLMELASTSEWPMDRLRRRRLHPDHLRCFYTDPTSGNSMVSAPAMGLIPPLDAIAYCLGSLTRSGGDMPHMTFKTTFQPPSSSTRLACTKTTTIPANAANDSIIANAIYKRTRHWLIEPNLAHSEQSCNYITCSHTHHLHISKPLP